MKLDQIRLLRKRFVDEHLSQTPYPWAYRWECQETFQEIWDINVLDFANMYDRALTHAYSGSLWGGNHQSAKSIMIDFIAIDREYVRSMFKDLFTPQKDLTMRVERFHFHCDQLLEQLQKQNRRLNHHMHEGFYLPTLYLSLRFPWQICPYDPEVFSTALARIGAKEPAHHSLSRFVKIIPILQSQLTADENLMDLLRRKINLKDSQMYDSLWLSYEFYHFITTQKL
ncbi:MAG: hypothetical protein KDC53_23075 [Saprospiraceae bacterium]|nr:hypothetical protein [Saprospiraceae bacterium]